MAGISQPGGCGVQEAGFTSPVSGSTASSAERGSRRRRGFYRAFVRGNTLEEVPLVAAEAKIIPGNTLGNNLTPLPAS
jgi:hypothetical protein